MSGWGRAKLNRPDHCISEPRIDLLGLLDLRGEVSDKRSAWLSPIYELESYRVAPKFDRAPP